MSSKMLCNIKMTKKCAFCKHWYDPANHAIEPVKPTQGLWKFSHQTKNICTLNNINKPGFASCNKFECKL